MQQSRSGMWCLEFWQQFWEQKDNSMPKIGFYHYQILKWEDIKKKKKLESLKHYRCRQWIFTKLWWVCSKSGICLSPSLCLGSHHISTSGLAKVETFSCLLYCLRSLLLLCVCLSVCTWSSFISPAVAPCSPWLVKTQTCDVTELGQIFITYGPQRFHTVLVLYGSHRFTNLQK